MNAGLPGTGIGGLFYIMTALWMPAHRLLARRSVDGSGNGGWRRTGAQFGIAVGILAMLGATGWLIGAMIALPLDAASGGGVAAARAARIFHWVALVGTVGIMAMVLLVVELAGLLVRRRAPVGARARAREGVRPLTNTAADVTAHSEPGPIAVASLADVA
jgi:hypothetical protein